MADIDCGWESGYEDQPGSSIKAPMHKKFGREMHNVPSLSNPAFYPSLLGLVNTQFQSLSFMRTFGFPRATTDGAARMVVARSHLRIQISPDQPQINPRSSELLRLER